MSTIVKGTSGLKSTELLAKTQFIIERMTGNPAFPNPVPALSTVSDAAAALSEALVSALDGGKTATAIKNARHNELRLLVNQLAGHVASVAEGNALAILSSGFAVRRPGGPRPEPATPKDLRASITDHVGRVELVWSSLPEAVTYHIQHTTVDPSVETNWKLVSVTTKARMRLTDLPSGQVSYFRVAGIGTAGMGPWSQVASTLVR